MLDINEIEKLIPHRFPFLLIDRILEIDEGKRAVGIKNVTMNDYFFQGHFPGKPIMPGVLMIESMAQLGACALMQSDKFKGKLLVLTGVNRCKFRGTVVPGDQMRIEIQFSEMKMGMGKGKGKITVDDKLICEAELMFAAVDSQDEK